MSLVREMEAEALPDSTTAAVVNFASAAASAAVSSGTAQTTIGMDVDASFPDLFLSNEQVKKLTD